MLQRYLGVMMAIGLTALAIVLLLVLVWIPHSHNGASDAAVTQGLNRASVAAEDVEQTFEASTGLFCPPSGTCWWWTANDLTALADYGRLSGTTSFASLIATTYSKAGLEGPSEANIGPFLDTWNDDDGWWGLAWVSAYRYVSPLNPVQADHYLQLAENIFAYMASQWNTTSCGGGLWQNQKTDHTKDAIANELFLSLAAQLYQVTGTSSYLTWAQREWTWFEGSGLIGSNHLVDDHLTNPGCAPQGTQYWTYNQGVILGGLTDLYQIERAKDPTAAKSALDEAEKIATCVTSTVCGGDPSIANPPLVNAQDILTEPCETNPCTYTSSYPFKGIFVRNLGELNSVTGLYSTFLSNNAASLWDSDRNTSNVFGFYWTNPPAFYLPTGSAPALEGAALDLLNTQIEASE